MKILFLIILSIALLCAYYFYGHYLRRCLKTHKIIFETITATLLSIMALVVSCSQTKLTEIQTKPRLIFSFEKLDNDLYYDITDVNEGDGYKIWYILKIENKGNSSVKNFKSDINFSPYLDTSQCNKIDYNDLNPQIRAFPAVLIPEEVYISRQKSKILTNNGRFIVRLLLEYNTEYSFQRKKLKLLYIFSKTDAHLVCREE